MGDALVAIDAGGRSGQDLLVHGLHEVLLLAHDVRVKYVAVPAVLRIGFLEFRPHLLGHACALFFELFFRGNDSASLADRILYAGSRLVPQEPRVIVRNVTVMTGGAHTGLVDEMDALPVLLRHPLHRMARAAA